MKAMQERLGEEGPLNMPTQTSSPQQTLRGYAAIGKQWWSADPGQRFWMELVNVDAWGSVLVAPELPRHALMYDVKPGDVVFHWVGKNNPRGLRAGMYGYSTVAGKMAIGAGEWLGEPANAIPLADYHDFDQPVYLEAMRSYSAGILSALEILKESTKQTIHFPFQKHPTIGLKPNQRYLSKFPSQLLDVIPELRLDGAEFGVKNPASVPPLGDTIRESGQQLGRNGADSMSRTAFGTAEVKQAAEHYEGQGYVVTDVSLTHSFDLIAHRGNEIRHIAVKGMQGQIGKIHLTRQEVEHAIAYPLTDLVIVREIDRSRESEKGYSIASGDMDILTSWRPSLEKLKPINYEYFLG